MAKTVLVTGSLGYLGSRLTPYLAEHGFRCIGYDAGFFRDCTLYPAQDPQTTLKDLRQLEPSDLEGVDAVVHLAAISNDPFRHFTARQLYDPTRDYSIRLAQLCKEVGIEFHSLSKTFNMTGWRIGWAAGNADVVGALGALKMNLDSGVFSAIQRAGVAALREGARAADEIRATYRSRRDAFCGACRDAGIEAPSPAGAFYVWAPVPRAGGGEAPNSMEFSARLLERGHVVVTPGNGFGPSGEGYFRVALTVGEDRLREAVRRMVEVLKSA